jgi:hypothetical protein
MVYSPRIFVPQPKNRDSRMHKSASSGFFIVGFSPGAYYQSKPKITACQRNSENNPRPTMATHIVMLATTTYGAQLSLTKNRPQT